MPAETYVNGINPPRFVVDLNLCPNIAGHVTEILALTDIKARRKLVTYIPSGNLHAPFAVTA